MDANQKRAMVARVKRTMENLEKNGFSTAFVYTREEALTLLKSLIPEKSVTAAGGSMTLREIGALEYLEASTDFRKDYMEAYDADCYLLSANAITEHGEIYQTDGTSNRISAMLYGPKRVIVVAGINKIVGNLRQAVERTKRYAAPPNAIRLCRSTPCARSGECCHADISDTSLMAEGCASDERICCNTAVFSKQSSKGRITVVIVGEDLGY